MGRDTILEIERAIDKLNEQQLQELYSWLDQRHPQPVDARIEADLAAGRLDAAIRQALDDDHNGRVKSL